MAQLAEKLTKRAQEALVDELLREWKKPKFVCFFLFLCRHFIVLPEGKTADSSSLDLYLIALS